MAETTTNLVVDDSRLPLLDSHEKELVSEVMIVTNVDECARTKCSGCPVSIRNIFGFVFQRITYYCKSYFLFYSAQRRSNTCVQGLHRSLSSAKLYSRYSDTLFQCLSVRKSPLLVCVHSYWVIDSH